MSDEDTNVHTGWYTLEDQQEKPTRSSGPRIDANYANVHNLPYSRQAPTQWNYGVYEAARRKKQRLKRIP